MGLNDKCERLVNKWNENIHIVRAGFSIATWMMFMAGMALPVLERIVPMGGKAAHYEYLLFSYRLWREGTVKEESRKKCLASVGCVALTCIILAFSPLLTLNRYNRTVIVGLILAIVALVFSVVNMYIGMYHFNESPGSEHVGRVTWGPCQTIHLVAAALLFIPISYLIYEKRKLKNGHVLNMAPKTRRVLLIVPQILAAILTIAGAATPQAWNHKGNSITAMHYDIMSFDYDMSYIQNELVCAPFFNRLVFGAISSAQGCVAAFVAFAVSIFAPRRPLIAFFSMLIAFCFAMCSVAFVGI